MIMSLIIQFFLMIKYSKVMDQIILSHIQITSLIYDTFCVHDNVLSDTKYFHNRIFYGHGSNYFVLYQITSLIYDIICVHDNVHNDPKYFMIKFCMLTDQII